MRSLIETMTPKDKFILTLILTRTINYYNIIIIIEVVWCLGSWFKHPLHRRIYRILSKREICILLLPLKLFPLLLGEHLCYVGN